MDEYKERLRNTLALALRDFGDQGRLGGASLLDQAELDAVIAEIEGDKMVVQVAVQSGAVQFIGSDSPLASLATFELLDFDVDGSECVSMVVRRNDPRRKPSLCLRELVSASPGLECDLVNPLFS